MEKEKLNMIFSQGRGEIEVPALVEHLNGTGYVSYGDDNRFPDYLYNLYTKCSTEKAVIDSIVDYAANFTTNSTQTSTDDVITKCIFDLVLFGGFAVQINRMGDYQQVRWLDFKNLRTNEDKTVFWYSQDWGKGRRKSIQLPAYSPNITDRTSVFYFVGNSIRDGHTYPQPRYSGALLDMETSVEISKFWNSSIFNGLEASAIVSFNNGTPSQEVQEEIEKKVNNKFGGASNAGRTIITFADSSDQAPTIQRLSSDNFDQKYNALTETIEQRIFTAFRINPILCGINVKTGFSKQEFVDAYNLAYITVIQPLQKQVKVQFEKLGINIEFQKVTIYDDGETGIEKAEV